MEHFSQMMDYKFTTLVEEQFDTIATGKLAWKDMLSQFYTDFHEAILTADEHADRMTGERELGVDPESKRRMIARMGRYGPMVQIGHQDDEQKPKYAKLQPNQSLETITLEEGLKLFDMPRDLGELDGESLVIGIGRYGPYVRHGKVFASIPEDHDPYTIDYDTAKQILVDKKEAEKNKYIHTWDDADVQVLRGRYGPYIKASGKNYKIPRGTVPEDLTLAACHEIIDASTK